MQRTFFYTQIKHNDFDKLKETCQPFSKDIFSADQEHIVAFDKSSSACKAALKFLNQIQDESAQHDYKIVLVQGEFTQDRPEELPVRIARSIHQHANPKNLYVTEEILSQIHGSDIVFEQKDELFVKALQKKIPTFSLTRFEETELQIDPTDLFDFSQVDSYSAVSQVSNLGKPAPKPRDPFESSNTTIELDPIRKKLDTDKVKPYVTGPQTPMKTPPSKPQSSRPQSPTAQAAQASQAKGQAKSVFIILVLLVIVTSAGLYLAKSKNIIVQSSSAPKTLPLPEIPAENATATTTPPPIIGTGPVPPIKQTGTAAAAIPAAPVPQIGYIHIHSAPPGAMVWVNGKKMGTKTPLDNLKVSTKEPLLIEVQKAGYSKASKMLDLTPKETRTVNFTLSGGSKAKATPKKKSKKR